ncbi:MAG: VWA domain-containing protein [Acidobacteriota bacterium]
MKLKTTIALVFCLLLSMIVSAQSGRVRDRAKSSQKDDVLRLRAEEVLLTVSVRSFNGKLPSHLDPRDFIVAEDDRRQHITAIQRTPANALLILDTSGELPQVKTINQNREAALKIIEGLASEDSAAIVTYSDKVELISAWTKDHAELRRALDWKFRPGLKARLYDSLLFASEEVLPKAGGRRSIVLITDGVDTFNPSAFSEAVKALHRARATVYIVSLSALIMNEINPRAFNPLSWYEKLDPQARLRIERLRAYAAQIKAADSILKRLVEETGGAMWTPTTMDEFRDINNRVIEEMGTEYVIAYSTDRKPDDESFHLVKVYPTHHDITVRARRGVYAGAQEEKRNR